MSEPKLLPCPFCGGNMDRFERDPISLVRVNLGLHVQCECGASGPAGKSLNDARKAWNTRAKPEHGEG